MTFEYGAGAETADIVGPIRIQAEEIAWGAFMPQEEVVARLGEWPFVPDGLEVLRRYLAESPTDRA